MPSTSDASHTMTSKEALDLYLRPKGYNKQKQFEVTAKRHIQYVVKCLCNRPIDFYSTADGSIFRDWLVNKGLFGSSVKRTFGRVKVFLDLYTYPLTSQNLPRALLLAFFLIFHFLQLSIDLIFTTTLRRNALIYGRLVLAFSPVVFHRCLGRLLDKA